jgi:hypothetical protein
MSVAMTNCGSLGWISDETGYLMTTSIPTAGSLPPKDERPLCPLTPRNSTTDYKIELRFMPCGSATPVMTHLVESALSKARAYRAL